MTASADTGVPTARSPKVEEPLGPSWREAAVRIQQAAMPTGRIVVSCTAPLGSGGLGRHLQEIVDASDRDGLKTVCISDSGASQAGISLGHKSGISYVVKILQARAMPTSRAIRQRVSFAEFDAYAARYLPPAEHLVAFNGQALKQFRAARRVGYESISLVSANPHLRHLVRQHTLASRHYPLEGSWATRLLARNLAEYSQADRIYVTSRYMRESFLQEGFSDGQLVDFPLTPDPRYTPRTVREASDRFEIVYVGSLAVHKGVPLLIDAVRRLRHQDLRLRLVGGWGTPGMRRFVQSACAEDPRIVVTPGDPLPHLRAAALCVHPAYEDGFAYAPAEALAAGVPVLVSEDTGMKELIEPGRTGLIVATGDLQSLTETIDAAYRGEVLVG